MYVAAKCHLTWPEPADSALSIAGAVVLWVLTASVALVLLGVCWWQRRPWLWSDVAVPVLVVIALGIAAAGQPHFDQYRADFETVAQQLLQEPDDPYSDGYHRDLRIGRFDISYANVSSEGHVYFYDARDGLDIGQSRLGVCTRWCVRQDLQSAPAGRHRGRMVPIPSSCR